MDLTMDLTMDLIQNSLIFTSKSLCNLGLMKCDGLTFSQRQVPEFGPKIWRCFSGCNSFKLGFELKNKGEYGYTMII